MTKEEIGRYTNPCGWLHLRTATGAELVNWKQIKPLNETLSLWWKQAKRSSKTCSDKLQPSFRAVSAFFYSYVAYVIMWLMLCAWKWKSAPPGETNRCESHKSIPTIGKQNKKKILFFRVGVLSAFRYLSQLCLASQWKFTKVFAVQWIRLIFRHIYCVHCLEVLGGIKIGSKSAINKYSLGRKYWKTLHRHFAPQ